MMPLWTCRAFLDVFLDAPGTKSIGTLDCDITGIAIDSRLLQQGDAFFAIKGEQFDGHDFIEEAFEKGAAVLIVAESHRDFLPKINAVFIIVADVLAALNLLATAARKRSQAKIIAITGSVGKTTTKDMLRHVLAPFGKVHASPASYNNQWGVPLTLARMPEETNFAIIEIGMNHANEILPLSKLVAPHIVLITRISAAHLGNFSSLEAIAEAKAEIFEGLDAEGTILLNGDDDFFPFLEQKARTAAFKQIQISGTAIQADYRLLRFSLQEHSSDFVVGMKGQEIAVTLQAPGYHMIQNALMICGVAAILNLDIKPIITALYEFTPPDGRGKRLEIALSSGGKISLIDESYNANPASMEASLALLGQTNPGPQGRRIAVLGDMLELGDFTRKAHEDLQYPLLQAGVCLAFLGGNHMAFLAEKLGTKVTVFHQLEAKNLLNLLITQLQDGDIVMVKSSHAFGSSAIVAALLDQASYCCNQAPELVTFAPNSE